MIYPEKICSLDVKPKSLTLLIYIIYQVSGPVKLHCSNINCVMCCFSANQGTLTWARVNTGWLPVKILHMSGATYLPVDRCFSELAQIKYKHPTRCGSLVQSSHQRQMDDIRSTYKHHFSHFDASCLETSRATISTFILC